MKKKPSAIQKTKNIMEMISFLVMASSYVFFGYIYYRYPIGAEFSSPIFSWRLDTIRTELIPPMLISSAIFILLFMMYRFPRFYKYPQKITAENIERQYHLSKIMLSSEIIVNGIFFTLLYVIMYYNRIGITVEGLNISTVILPITAAVIFITYYCLAKKKVKG